VQRPQCGTRSREERTSRLEPFAHVEFESAGEECLFVVESAVETAFLQTGGFDELRNRCGVEAAIPEQRKRHFEDVVFPELSWSAHAVNLDFVDRYVKNKVRDSGGLDLAASSVTAARRTRFRA
jgi:hypothetical protein